jgi:general secretion pathway protein N
MMKLPLVLLLLGPALPASAGTFDDRDAQALEPGQYGTSAPDTAHSTAGAAGPTRDAAAPAGNPSWANSAGGAAAPNRDAAAPAGNPLWAIPLNALTATRDRPLFSASRRPPPLAVETVAPRRSDPAPSAPSTPAPPERPPLTLMGTIVSAESSIALVSNSSTQAVLRLRVGEENSGWRVRGVDPRSIVVEKGVQSVTLDLPKPGGAPEQPPLNGPSPEVRRH